MIGIKLIRSRLALSSLTGTLLLLLASSQPALAFNFTTNDISDAVDNTPGDGICETGPANGICTLRAAIQESNAWPGRDSIYIPAGTYTLALSGADNISAVGDLDITDAVSLRGATQALSIIDGADIDRIFDIHNVDVQLENLSLQNGLANGVEGGGIRNLTGALTIRNTTLNSNETTGSGFGGGGIYSTGPLVIDNATITNNRSSRGGGLLQFTKDMTITNSRINSNTADIGAGSGGGIFIQSDGASTITNSTIDNNLATLGGGGGIYAINGFTLSDSTISNNQASLVGGGGIYNIGLSPLTITNSTISSNDATGNGGGIQLRKGNATIINSTIYNNRVFGIHDAAQETYNGHGGGLYVPTGYNVTLFNTIISGNTASVLVPAGANCYSQSDNGVFSAIQTVSENTISNDSTCELNGSGDQPNTNPSLNTTLGTNGGGTLTHSIPSSSTAVDLGTNTDCSVTDQRGFPRPVNGGGGLTCDIGAVEYNPTASVADIGVTLEETMDPVSSGGSFTYNIQVTNHGPDTANNVVVTDNLVGVTYVSDTGGCTGAPALSCTLGTITAGNSLSIAVTVTAPTTVGQVSNTASASATESDLNAGNNSATETTVVNGNTDLSITITGSIDPATANVPMTYTVVLTNNGPDTVNAVTPAVQFDSNMLIGSITPSIGSCSAITETGLLLCNFGNIANGTSANIIIEATPVLFGTITSTAYATFNGTDPNLANNTTSVVTNVISDATLTVTTIDTPDPAYENADIFYTFTMSNSGPSTTNNTQLVVTFPAGVSLSPATGASPTGCVGAGTVTCDVGSITGGQRKTVSLVAIASTTGLITVNVAATSNETAGEAVDSETTLVNPAPTPTPPSTDLLITMVDTADPVVVGTNITYNVTATNNNGPNVAQSVVITVLLASSTTFNSASAGCSHASGVVSCSLGALAIDADKTVSIDVTPTSVGLISASATVSDSVGNDPALSNNSVTQSTRVNSAGGGTAASRLNSGGGGSYATSELSLMLFILMMFGRRRNNNHDPLQTPLSPHTVRQPKNCP